MLIALLFAGCGAKPRVLSVPQVLIQALELGANGMPGPAPGRATGNAAARVLLHNFSNVTMHFSELDYHLSIDGVESAADVVALDLEVPMDSPESVQLTLTLSARALRQLQHNTSVAYALHGTIRSSKPSRTFEFQYEGRLSATPGKSGYWR